MTGPAVTARQHRPAVPLAGQLLLLASWDGSGTLHHGLGDRLDHGLAAALLVELALAGRVAVTGGRLTVTDPTPTGDVRLDAILRRMAGARRPRSPARWMSGLARHARQPVLDGLVEAGVLRRESRRVLGIPTVARYPSGTGAEPAATADARHRVDAAAEGDGPIDATTGALCVLVGALGWERRVFPDLPVAVVRDRLAEIGTGTRAGPALRRVVDDVELAVLAAVLTGAG